MTEPLITVQMSEDDAILFRAFKEHQDNFSILYASQAFNVRGGSFTTHVNLQGIIDSVDTEAPLYRRGHQKIQFLSTRPQIKSEIQAIHLQLGQ